jgi:hypothetical protein
VAGYKTGAGIEPALLAQFHPLEEALDAMGVAVWPMTELEADDGARLRRLSSPAPTTRAEGLHLDAGQGPRAVRPRRARRADGPARQPDPRRGRCDREVRRPTGLIPDYLALVGDTADGYPGIPGIGAVTAARLLNEHGGIDFPPDVLGARTAISRCCSATWPRCGPDAPLFDDVDELRWHGPTEAFDVGRTHGRCASAPSGAARPLSFPNRTERA